MAHLETQRTDLQKGRVFLKKIVEIHDFPVGFSWKSNLKTFWKVFRMVSPYIIVWWFSSGTSAGLDKLYDRLWNLESFPIFHRGDLICWRKIICWRKRILLGCAHEIMDYDQRYEMSGHETIFLYQLTLSYLISIFWLASSLLYSWAIRTLASHG